MAGDNQHNSNATNFFYAFIAKLFWNMLQNIYLLIWGNSNASPSTNSTHTTSEKQKPGNSTRSKTSASYSLHTASPKSKRSPENKKPVDDKKTKQTHAKKSVGNSADIKDEKAAESTIKKHETQDNKKSTRSSEKTHSPHPQIRHRRKKRKNNSDNKKNDYVAPSTSQNNVQKEKKTTTPSLNDLIKIKGNYLHDNVSLTNLFPKKTFWLILVNFLNDAFKKYELEKNPFFSELHSGDEKKLIQTLSKEIGKIKYKINHMSEPEARDKKLLLCYRYIRQQLKHENPQVTLNRLKALSKKIGLTAPKYKILCHVEESAKSIDIAEKKYNSSGLVIFEVERFSDFFHTKFMPMSIWKGQDLILSWFAIPEDKFDKDGHYLGQEDYARSYTIFESKRSGNKCKQEIGFAPIHINSRHRLMTMEYDGKSKKMYHINETRDPSIDAALLKPNQTMNNFLENLIDDINKQEEYTCSLPKFK